MKWRRLFVVFGILALAACSDRSQPWFPEPEEEEEEDEDPDDNPGMSTAFLDLGEAGVVIIPA